VVLTQKSEWLLTNRFGGYASSTFSCINTRTYHALLNSASLTKGFRVQLLNTLEEHVQIDEEVYPLSAHRYRDVIYPEGHKNLESFGFKKRQVWWQYKLGEFHVYKTILFNTDRESLVISYSSTKPFVLKLRPLLSFRSHHLCQKWGEPSFVVEKAQNEVVVKEEKTKPTLVFSTKSGSFVHSQVWYYGFLYEEDKARGVNHIEDLFSPGEFTLQGDRVELDVRVEPALEVRHPTIDEGELSKFVVDTHNFQAIIAGYHWFWEWCRDSMVVLPVLVERTRSLDFARRVLTKYFSAMDQGFLPTGFDENNKPFYTSVDSSLWSAYAVKRISALGAQNFVFEFVPYFEKMFEGYSSGSKFGVKLTQSLIYHASPGATWMDASFEGKFFTPRTGYAVEVNALWLLTLKLLSEYSQNASDRAYFAEELKKANENFLKLFSCEQGLADTLDNEFKKSPEIRPNSLFALAFGFVDEQTAKRTLSTVRRHLLTPFGIRTLSPLDPLYKPKYEGDREARDAAYHNGSVWPWLVGAYFDSCELYDSAELEYFSRTIKPLLELAKQNNGLVPEIFDGEPPHTPRGCIAQAWSVCELLRVASRLKQKGLLGTNL